MVGAAHHSFNSRVSERFVNKMIFLSISISIMNIINNLNIMNRIISIIYRVMLQKNIHCFRFEQRSASPEGKYYYFRPARCLTISPIVVWSNSWNYHQTLITIIIWSNWRNESSAEEDLQRPLNRRGEGEELGRGLMISLGKLFHGKKRSGKKNREVEVG